jgi:uncharacterized protein YycO
MPHLIRDEDIRVDIGRANDGKTFARVVHMPTQVSRVVIGLRKRSSRGIVRELCSAVLQETEAAGWCRTQTGHVTD